MASKGEGDVEAIEELQKLQKQLGKKQTFEAAVSSIAAHLRDRYASASPPLRRSIYSAVCRVATILQTRYTAPGFWQAGLRLFEEAGRLVAEPSERNHLRSCVVRAREHLHEAEYPPDVSNSAPDTRFLFEGHLTVGPEPPAPAWLVAQNFLTTLAATQNLDVEAEPNVIERDNNNSRESNSRIDVPAAIQELINNMQEIGGAQDLESVIEASLREVGAGPQRPPPASKEVVAKLPIVIVTEEVLGRLGSEMECAVCRENLVINDKMQELPCKHLFHPDCLKPWLDEHNSCPTCRHELQTDDHAYESWKEREKEAEEERKGAANALRGGEYMYV